MAKHQAESPAHSGELSLMMGSETLTVQGSWKYNEPESVGIRADLNSVAIDFDFLINVENHNNVIHPKDVAYVKRVCKRLQQGKTVDYSFRIIGSDGMVRPLQGSGVLIDPKNKTEKNNTYKNDLATLDEVSDDAELQYKILRLGEQVFLVGSWTWNLETDELYFSENFYRLCGIEPYSTDPSWESFVSFVHPADKEGLLRIAAAMKESHEPAFLEYRLVCSNGAITTVQSKNEFFTTRKGQQYFIGTIQDISDVRKKETQLTEANQWFRAVIDNAANSMMGLQCVRDSYGNVTDFLYLFGNKKAEQSVNRSNLAGKYLALEFPEVKTSGLFDRYVAVANTGVQWSDVILYHHDGFHVWSLVTASKLLDGCVVTDLDITAKRTAELELRRTNDLLQSVFDLSANSIYVLQSVRDEEGAISDFEYILANSVAEERMGHVTSSIGKRILQEFPGSATSAVVDRFKRVIMTGECDHFEQADADDNHNVCERISVVKFEDGVVVTSESIVDYRLAELELIGDYGILQAVVDTNDTGLAVCKSIRNETRDIVDFEFILTNKKTREFTKHDELTGKRVFEEFPGTGIHLEVLRQVVESGEKNVCEYHYTAEGLDVWLSNSNSKLGDGFISVWEDITEKKKAATKITSQHISGGGEMGEIIRTRDWSGTPLGVIQEWAPSLKTSLNLILNSRQPMCVAWGPGATFLYNDAYLTDVLGLSKHPWALGQPFATVWAEIWDICGPLVERIFSGGESSVQEDVRFYMVRGEYVCETYVTFSYSPVLDEEEKVSGLFCSCQNVTWKTIQARRLATLSELAMNTLVEKTTAAACASVAKTLAENPDDIPFALLYLIDAEGATAELRQVVGLSDGSPLLIRSMSLNDSVKDQSPFNVTEVFKTSQPGIVSLMNVDAIPEGVARRRVRRAVVLPVETSGQSRPVAILVAAVNPASALNDEYLGFHKAMSNQIAVALANARLAEEARRQLEVMVDLDRARVAFFNNVSHEFRTPIMLILGQLAELIKPRETALRQAETEKLKMAYRNALRLEKMVNALLHFARIEAGRMEIIYQPTDLSKLTTNMASTFRSAIEGAGMKLIVKCDPLATPVFVNRDMWEHIVMNLLSNAFKFTFEGRIEVRIKSRLKHVELQVRDTGIGISPENLQDIFKRFHRIEGVRSRMHGGFGIGLALVKELVLMHGGKIRVRSKVASGTAFTVSIPKGGGHLPHERVHMSTEDHNSSGGAEAFVLEAMSGETPSAYSDARKNIGSLKKNTLSGVLSAEKPKILVVDDNADMRDYLKGLLLPNYYVVTSENGKKAMNLVQRGLHPDLVLADVSMPEMDGFELLHWLKENRETRLVPVILVSGHEGEEARVAGMRHGADDYLVKPFSTRELIARIEARIEISNVRNFTERHLRVANQQLDQRIQERTIELKRSKQHHRHLNQSLTESNQKLKLMHNELAAFALVASQNLREPLSIIHECCHTLLDREVFKLLGIGSDLFFRLLSSALYMKVVVDGIYTFSRVSFDVKEVAFCDLNELLEQVTHDFQDMIKAKMILIEHTELPVMKGSAPQLAQFFHSIIDYATKSRLPGSTLRIDISYSVVPGKKLKHPAASPYKTYLKIDFADDGAGIHAEQGKKILQLFEPPENPIDYQNLDIGLIICRKIVENHDGFITFKSSPGKGSLFTCYMAISK